MAFNPFRAFRKHQKALFAALTIMCMFVFVLSGASGFFQEWQSWLGGRGGYPELASIYGKSLTNQDLSLLQNQRELANAFMTRAITVANLNAGQAVQQAVSEGKLDPQTKQVLSEALAFRQQYVMVDPRTGFAGYEPGFLLQRLQQYGQSLPNIFGSLIYTLEQTHATLASQKSPDANLVEQMASVLDRDLHILLRVLPGGQRDWYFGGSRDPKELIDFLLLRHHADQLGIQLTDADISDLIRRETRGALTPQQSGQLLKELRQDRFRGLTADMLKSALGDEFRVRIVQQALLGKEYNPMLPGQEAALTPYEFWKFYRGNRAESQIVLASIPVEIPEFLKKVGKPTEQELRTLFEANKDREPNPASDQAGFKQPMRVQVQWVSAPTDSPLYRKAAAVEAAAVRATMPLAYDLALLQIYDQEKFKYPVPSWLGWRFVPEEKNVNRLENVVAAVTQPAGSGWPSIAAASAFTFSAAEREARERAPKVASLVLAAGSGNLLTALAPAYLGTPKSESLPFEAVRDRIAKKMGDDLATEVGRNNLNALREFLTTHARAKSDEVRGFLNSSGALAQALAIGASLHLGFIPPAAHNALLAARDILDHRRVSFEFLSAGLSASPWLAALLTVQRERLAEDVIRSQVAELLKRYGLEEGTTTRPQDRFNIARDTGLRRLREAFDRTRPGERAAKQEKQFATELFEMVGGQGALYQPQPLDNFLFWKTEEEPPYVPTFEEARPKVEARWAFEKARTLAKAEAEKVAAEARKAKGDAEKNLADAAGRYGALIRLDKVARLVPRPSMVPSAANFNARSYEPYQIPPSDVEYPSKDFAERLFDLKEKGDVAVLHDAPEAIYYVATLVNRSEPFELAFVTDASRPESLLAYWDKDTQFHEKFRQGCMEELRREAKLRYNEKNLETWKRPNSSDEE
jgi:hypothetical protein